MKKLNQLSADLKSFQKELRKAANESAKGLAVQTVRILASSTRVDTSRALSNWRATVGFPATKEIEPYFMGESGSTREASVGATIEAAKFSVRNKKLGQNVFITNNVDYMDYLANGPSLQGLGDWIETLANISERNWKFKYPVSIG